DAPVAGAERGDQVAARRCADAAAALEAQGVGRGGDDERAGAGGLTGGETGHWADSRMRSQRRSGDGAESSATSPWGRSVSSLRDLTSRNYRAPGVRDDGGRADFARSR